MGALLRAKSSSISSVARLLYTISDVLPQTASAGMVLYRGDINKLTEVVFTNFSKMPRETFFAVAREAVLAALAAGAKRRSGGNVSARRPPARENPNPRSPRRPTHATPPPPPRAPMRPPAIRWRRCGAAITHPFSIRRV